MSGTAYHETFLYKHLEVVAEADESMLVRQSARGCIAEMDEQDAANGNSKPEPEAAPSDEAATVA